MSATSRPRSAVCQLAAFGSLLGGLLVVGLFKWTGNTNTQLCFLLAVAALTLPHLAPLWSVPRTHQQAPAVPFFSARVGTKIIGLLATLALVALAYFMFGGFTSSFARPLLGLVGMLWIPALAALPFYIAVTDRRMPEPEDGLYRFGKFVSGRPTPADFPAIGQYLLGWLVKGFFCPLMVSFVLNDLDWALKADLAAPLTTPALFYDFSYRSLFFIDVLFAASGYLLTFKVLDTHIKSTEPTMTGWVVCILCYPPFWDSFANNFFRYEEGYYWGEWLSAFPLLWSLWAAAIIACLAVYAWATVSFGIRFSNLTNRGTISNGPYRWLKHPAYVSKNLSWWLISVPFLTNGPPETAVRNCLALLGINCIYYLRAKTEERHLLRDPDYVAYSAWMVENSLYSRFALWVKKTAIS